MRADLGVAVVAVAVVLAAGGCSSEKSKTEPTAASSVAAEAGTSAAESAAPGAESGTVFKGSFTVTAPVSHTGTFVDSVDGIGIASCADAASKGNGGTGHGAEGSFQVPGPPMGEPLSDQLRVSVEARSYAGPGDYPGDKLSGNVQIDKGAYYSVADGGATSKLTVKADGSGQLTFKGAKDSAGGGTADGSITWTCSSS